MRSVTLGKKLDRAIRAGAPWIYRDALDRPPRLRDGEVVTVETGAGRPVATGFWDTRSAIAVRVLEAGPVEDPPALVETRLREALARRLTALDRTRTNAFRWVHGEADRLPGLHADLYDDVAVLRFDGGGAREFYAHVAKQLAGATTLRGAIDRDGTVLAGRVPETLTVRENGLLFEVSPGRASKGGLFLDQRENRERVEMLSSGSSVLNLFGYTGGFSLYAARGGAASTDTVDVSRPALAAARRNFALNALPLALARFHEADVFDFLEAGSGRRRFWDLVISDPPSFAPSRVSLPAARRAYFRLHQLAVAVTSPGGLLCAASCSSHFSREEHLENVREAARSRGRRFEVLEVHGAGCDHPVIPAFPEGDYLKFAIGRVR
ncbi:MAG: class I SAM-dependent rRNA methyltransferase [Planctomycetota bacterium]